MASHKSEKKSHRFGWSLAYDMKLFKEHALFVKNSQEHNALIAFRKVDVPLLRDIHEHLKDVDFTRINRKHKSVIELLTHDEQVQKDAQAQATKVKEEHEQEHAKQEQPDDADSDADCDDDDDDDDEDDEDAEDEDEDSSDSYNSDEALPETPPLKKRKSNRPSSSSRQPRPPSNCSSLRTGSKMTHPQKRNQQSRKENTNTKRTKKDKKNAVLMMLDRSATVSHHLAVMVITHCVRGMRVAS